MTGAVLLSVETVASIKATLEAAYDALARADTGDKRALEVMAEIAKAMAALDRAGRPLDL